MTEKTEALRLADELDGIPLADMTEALADDAAAELRRLHEENGRLRIVAEMSTLLLDQRKALLEALKSTRAFIHSVAPHGSLLERVNAAIKVVEGEKK